MRSCTVSAMAKTISNLCPTMANKIELRRKYRITSSGQLGIWWLLICADEEVLLELEKIWGTGAVQTSWWLEDCVKFADPKNSESSTVDDSTTSEAISSCSLGTSVSHVSASQSENSNSSSSRDPEGNNPQSLTQTKRLCIPNHSNSQRDLACNSKSKNVTILYYNAKRLLSKINELRFLAETNCPSVSRNLAMV